MQTFASFTKASSTLLFSALAFFWINQAQAQVNTPVASSAIDDTSKVYIAVEKMPEYPGGQNALFNFLSHQFAYPESLKKDSINGTAVFTFIVSPTGKVHAVEVIRKVHPLIDAEGVRMLQSMPLWIPGEQNGKARRVKYTIPFRISGYTDVKAPVIPEQEKVHTKAEVLPAFPGGHKALEEALKKNYAAPVYSKLRRPSDLVFFSVTLSKDGSIKTTDTRLLKGAGAAIDTNLLQAINKLPAFTPALVKKQPVVFNLVLAIRVDETGIFLKVEQGTPLFTAQ